jgi:hypothetical protein
VGSAEDVKSVSASLEAEADAADRAMKAEQHRNELKEVFGFEVDETKTYRSVQTELLDELAYEKMHLRIDSHAKMADLEMKLDEITERTVTVYKCVVSECPARKWREGRGDYCTSRGHTFKQKKVKKRWFICRNCRDKTVTYDRTMPTVNCRCNDNGKCYPLWELASEYARKRSRLSDESDRPQLVVRLDDSLGSVPKYVNENEREDAGL